MSCTMVCDNCPFINQCSIGGEHMLIDAEVCPLYLSLENKFREQEEIAEKKQEDQYWNS